MDSQQKEIPGPQKQDFGSKLSNILADWGIPASGVAFPAFFISPFGYGMPMYGYGYGYGGGMSPLFTIILVVALGAIAFQMFSGRGALEGGFDDEYIEEYGQPPVSVGKVQVGLLGSAKSIKKSLERMANTVDTSSSDGLHTLLQETVLSLIRNPEYCEYASSVNKYLSSSEKAEKAFNSMSLAERGKFRSETLTNVSGSSRSAEPKKGDGVPGSEMIVITIIVAAEGKLDLPKLNNQKDLKDALSQLGGVGRDQLVAVEILWTPQDDNEYLSRDEIMADYPDMTVL